jgi:hypothetical protein
LNQIVAGSGATAGFSAIPYPARKPIGELVKQLEELPRPSEIEARDDEVLPEPPGL